MIRAYIAHRRQSRAFVKLRNPRAYHPARLIALWLIGNIVVAAASWASAAL